MGEFKVPHPHYDIKALAKSLKLASIDVIKTSKMDIESHWFRSLGPADLYFWKVKNKIVKHQISIYNQIIEWNEYDGVKTGFVNDDEAQQHTETICFDEEVNPNVIRQALDFLEQVESIDKKVIAELKDHYHFYNRWPFITFFNSSIRFFKKSFKKG